MKVGQPRSARIRPSRTATASTRDACDDWTIKKSVGCVHLGTPFRRTVAADEARITLTLRQYLRIGWIILRSKLGYGFVAPSGHFDLEL